MARLLFPHRIPRLRLLVILSILTGLSIISYMQTTLTAQVQDQPTTVAITQASTDAPSDAQIEQLVRDAVAKSGGLPSGIGPGQKVLIQPNIVSTGFACGSGAVTNKQVVRTVVKLCRERGVELGNICIAEGTAGGDGRNSTTTAFRDAGYDANGDMVDDATGVNLVDLNDAGGTQPDYRRVVSDNYDTRYVTPIDLPQGLLDKKYWISNALAEADFVIKCPVLKNHELAGVTGALKLAVGTAPADIYHMSGSDGYKYGLVHDTWGRTIDEPTVNQRAIVDLNLCKKPDFVVIDGLVGITNGPVGGVDGGVLHQCDPKMRIILAGSDPVATDTIQSLTMGYDPESIPSIVLASSSGLGTKNVGLITVKGVHVKDVRYLYPVPYPNRPSPATRCDMTPPALDGLNIADGATVSGIISVEPINPRDSLAVAKGELYVDNELAASNNMSSYNCTLDTSQLAPGSHQIKYILYDKGLNEASVTQSIIVSGASAIQGYVRSSSGAAISGATVSTNTGGYTTTSGSTGYFTLANVAPGTYNVTASKTGYNSQTNTGIAVTANQATTTNFSLISSTGSLIGYVKDASNNAISGALVSTNTGGYSATSSSDGSYILSNVAPGTYSVTASKTGYTPQTKSGISVTAGAATTCSFSLPVQQSTFAGLLNPGFESGYRNDPNVDHQIANNWNKFVLSGALKQSGWYGHSHSGNWSQSLYDSGTWTAGIYQNCTGATPGHVYTASVWVAGLADSGGSQGSADIKFKIGVDPAGGTDASSANVVWSTEIVPNKTWTKISQGATAVGVSVTVFIKAQNVSWAPRYAAIDDASITDEAPSTGIISGAVKDAAGNSISGAAVSASPGSYSSTTDAYGNYTIAQVVPGTYTVTAAKTGYDIATKSGVAVSANQTAVANFTLTAGAPGITTQPQSQTKAVGEACTFSVSAGGTAPLNYQWRKGGTNISGAAASSYAIASVQLTDAGSYDCVVSNLGGSVNSSAAVLTVTRLPLVLENFETMPDWTSSLDASWGGAATWSIASGGQSGNYLQAFRNNAGSSTKVKVYTVPANTSITASVYIKCPTLTATSWVEFGYRFGSRTADDFDSNPGVWTMVKRFTDNGTNGNGNTWTKYSATFSTGANTQVSFGFKVGTTSGDSLTVSWDSLTLDTASTGTLSGNVKDGSGNNLQGASVITTPGGFAGITDGSGNYTILQVDAGTYSVTASKQGYNSQTVNNISVTTGNTSTANFTLTASTISPVTAFTVNASDTFNKLTWINSISGSFYGTMIRCKTTGYPTGPNDGTLVCDRQGTAGIADTFVHTQLKNGTTYYYAAFAHTSSSQYAGGANASGTPYRTGACNASKIQADNSVVSLLGKVVTAVFSSGSSYYIYVEDMDRTSGIRISVPSASTAAVGDIVDVSGNMASFKDDGVHVSERVVVSATVTKIASGLALDPLLMNSRFLGGSSLSAMVPGVANGAGLNTMGLLVKICGTVTGKSGTDIIYVDDGSRISEESGTVGVKVKCVSNASYSVGNFVTVAGIAEGNIPSGLTTNRRFVHARAVDDVVKLR